LAGALGAAGLRAFGACPSTCVDGRQLARHANALAVVLDFDFGQAGFGEQVRQLAHGAPESMAMFAFDFPPLESLAPNCFTSLMFIPFDP
jgi:hypothetical protein